MKVILEIDDKYANVLTVTAVGCDGFQTRVATHATDLSKNSYLTLDKNGKWTDRGNNDD